MFTQLKHSYKRMGVKGVIRYIKSFMPPMLACELVFKKRYGRSINKNNPVYLDEKVMIIYSTNYCKNSLVSQCADKYRVREYVEETLGNKDILTELLGVFDSSSEIEWDKLPKQFALKCNHGSGYNIIVKDKEKVDKITVSKQLDYWLEENYGRVNSELQYRDIPPKIIAEEFLEGQNGASPWDYKFMCSHGKVLYCMIVTGHEGDTRRVCLDENFNDLHLMSGELLTDYERFKPPKYSDMWHIAEKLSRAFPFVRVDLYDVNGRIVFGELTFTPMGCINDYFEKDAQIKIGSQIRME